MSLKKMHEEQKENRQSQQLQGNSSPGLMKQSQTELIEQQRQVIVRQEKVIEQKNQEFESMKTEFRRRLEMKENQRKRAWEEADKVLKAPPRIEIRERYSDKCNSCKLEEYRQAVHASRRYVRFLTLMLAAGIVCEIIQSRFFLQEHPVSCCYIHIFRQSAYFLSFNRLFIFIRPWLFP